MKKKVLLLVSVLLLVLMSVNFVYASSVYVPQVNNTDVVVTSDDLKKELSERIRAVHTVMECKDIVQDVNQLEFITFGQTSLSDDPSAKDDIEWIVLDKNDTEAILLSRKVLDKSVYNDGNNAVEYKNTNISKCVEDFIKKAFSDKEMKVIKKRTIPSKTDIDKYFASSTGDKQLAVTSYARGDGKKLDYWLRNEETSQTGMYFSIYGSYFSGQFGETFGVRPMITVELSPIE